MCNLVCQRFTFIQQRFDTFRAQIDDMLDLLLPAFREEGKSHLTVAFGCTGGRHRSVTMAEITATRLAESGWQVSKRHRDVDRTAEKYRASHPKLGDAASPEDGEA